MVYSYAPGRGGDHAAALLQGYSGVLQTDGYAAYRSLADVPSPVDLVVVAVPAPAVEAEVAESARAGARGVVVISAGFAVVSEEGRAAQ